MRLMTALERDDRQFTDGALTEWHSPIQAVVIDCKAGDHLNLTTSGWSLLLTLIPFTSTTPSERSTAQLPSGT